VPKKFKVHIADTAKKDIGEIWMHIALCNPQNATTFIKKLEHLALSLESMPERHPVIPEEDYLKRGYRHLVYKNYRNNLFRPRGYCKSASNLSQFSPS